MKQILALMTLFLILMLTITTVMAVGNVKQSQQMAQRMQLISSLRADLRSAKQEQETLNTQLEDERAASRTLRTERNALSKRYDHLMTLLRSQPVGYTDALPAPTSWTSPLIPPLAGESWLQAQALERLLKERQAAQTEAEVTAATAPSTDAAEAALAVTDQRLQEVVGTAKDAGEMSIFSVAGEASARQTPAAPARQTPAANPAASSATAALQATPASAIAAAPAQTASPAPTATPTAPACQTPVVSPAASSAIAAPQATPASAIAATPAQTASPAPTSTAAASARQTPTAPACQTPAANPAASRATPAPVPRRKGLPDPLPALQSALITGLDTLQHWLHRLDAAIDRAIDQLQPAATYRP